MKYTLIAILFLMGCDHAKYEESHKKGQLKVIDSFSGTIDSIPPMSYAEVTRDSVSVHACGLDTIKGLLYWHTPEIDYNEGQAWDTGYFVAKCGGMAVMGDPYVIPGEMILHRKVSEDDGKTWIPFDQVMNQEAKFYSSEWKEVPHKNVYCLIVLRPPTTP